ncbi:MAG: flagellar basal body rod protein FlgB [Syntrophales bacterium]
MVATSLATNGYSSWYVTCLYFHIHKTTGGETTMQALFGKTIGLLSGMLDYRAARHKVIVSNIANLDTPGFKPQDITFTASLAEAVSSPPAAPPLMMTNKNHLTPAAGKEVNFPIHQTGDKVEIDREMTNLAENNLMYNLTVELMSRKFKGIDTALRELK